MLPAMRVLKKETDFLSFGRDKPFSFRINVIPDITLLRKEAQSILIYSGLKCLPSPDLEEMILHFFPF